MGETVICKNTKAKTRKEKPFKLLNVFVVTRHNYKKVISYKVDNSVDKINRKVYIKFILLLIRQEHSDQGLTLV